MTNISGHTEYMNRALELARKGVGRTRPNPIVGAVVVRDGSIVGEGFHEKAGVAHAEVVALAQAGSRAAGAELYVTLEPCNHSGKTPPCTEAIISAGIRRVVYAVGDPVDHGTRAGSDVLKEAGIEVERGLCEDEVAFDNRFFLHAAETGRPWVIAKFAASLDGRIATHTGQSKWITGQTARKRAHELRSMVDGVLVGAGTVIADNPSLTVRLDSFDGLQPRRIVLDGRGQTSVDAALYSGSLADRTIVLTSHQANPEWVIELKSKGVLVLECDRNADSGRSLPSVLTSLHELGLQSIMIEGGPTVLGGFFDSGLVDEVWAFVSPRVIGGLSAPGAVGGLGVGKLVDASHLNHVETELLGRDVLVRGIYRQDKTAGKQIVEEGEICLQE